MLRAADGASVVLEIGGESDGDYVARIEDAEHVQVRDIQFRGAGGAWQERWYRGVEVARSRDVAFDNVDIGFVGGTLLYLNGDVTGFSLTRSHLHDNIEGYGVYAGCWDAACWTSDSRFENNWIHDLGVVEENDEHGIHFLAGGQGNTVTDNVIYRVSGTGIYASDTADGPPNIIERNAVWDAHDDGIRADGSARVRNNVVFNAGRHGIYSYVSSDHVLTDVVIASNTIVDTGDFGLRVERWGEGTDLVLANNAVCNPLGRGFWYEAQWEVETTNVVTGNVVTGLVDGLEWVLNGTDGWVEPGAGYGDFVDIENWDFYPSEGSLLRGVADADASAWLPEDDFNGAPRDAAAPDVGAYQWIDDANPGWTLQEGLKEPGYAVPDDVYELESGCCSNQGTGGAEALLLLLGLPLRRRRTVRDGR